MLQFVMKTVSTICRCYSLVWRQWVQYVDVTVCYEEYEDVTCAGCNVYDLALFKCPHVTNMACCNARGLKI